VDDKLLLESTIIIEEGNFEMVDYIDNHIEADRYCSTDQVTTNLQRN